MSEKDYLEQLGELFEKLRIEMPHASDQDIFERYREHEFDLMIDFRLGGDFPDERRQTLKKIHSRTMSKMDELKRSISLGKMTAHDYAEAVQQLVKQMAEDFGALLDQEEMEALCGNEFFGIPLDTSQIGHS